MSLSDIKLSPAVQRRIRERYKVQMRRWAPRFVQSHASPAAKGLMVMLTDLWERSPRRRRKRARERRIVRRRRPRWQKGGYGVYDLRMLRLFGEWIHHVEGAPL